MTSSIAYTKICVTVFIAMMTFHLAASLTCYDCTTVGDLGNSNCLVVNNKTATKNCSDYCQTIIPSIGGIVNRGCSTGNTTGCLAIIGCVYSCSTDLCNTNSAPKPTSQLGSVAILLCVAAVVGLMTQKIV